MKPQLIKAYTDSEGKVIGTVENEVVRRVISEDTSRIMRSALESVVSNGTASGAYVEGYRIGGKTGTSQKLPRSSGKKIASFIGFAPADDPQLVCLLILDEPGGNLTGGGAIAAPAVGKILAASLEYLGYEPKYDEGEAKIEMPDCTSMSVWDAKKQLINLGLSVSVHGDGGTVTNQLPSKGSMVCEGDTVTIYTEAVAEVKVEMPDFKGMTRQEALNKANELKLNATLSGGGASNEVTDDMLCVSQSTPPGTLVVQNSAVTLGFAVNNDE